MTEQNLPAAEVREVQFTVRGDELGVGYDRGEDHPPVLMVFGSERPGEHHVRIAYAAAA